MRPRRSLLALAVLAALAACRRHESGLFVVAPFNDETRIAKVEATWAPGPSGWRAEVRVENQLADSLYVRLSGFALVDDAGAPIATSDATRACIVAPHATSLVLNADLAATGAPARPVAAFAVQRFGLPLSERGRSIYREFELQQQVRDPAAVDAEIAAHLAAPPCGE